MKKGFLALFMLVCMCQNLYAEKTAEVSLRFSRQDSLVRVVLESEEDLIRNANTIASATSIRIDFPSPFNLIKHDGFLYETAKKDRTLTITLKDVGEARAYKLYSPARIVVELKETAQKDQKDTAQQQKPQAPLPSQSQQKTAEAQSSEKSIRVKTVIIDPGHGGYDYGLLRQEVREKDVNLSIANDLAALLQKKGVKVFITRKADQAMPIGERAGFGNSKASDIFISLHATASAKFIITTAAAESAGADSAANQYRISSRQNRHIEKSRAAAKMLGDILKTGYKTEVIYRDLPVPVLTSIDAAAFMLEYPLTAQKKYDQKERDKLINAVIKGLAPRE